MLSVVKFTLFDIFIAFLLLSAPWLMGAIILLFLIKAFRNKKSRLLLLWLLLPQCLATLFIGLGLNFYNVDTNISLLSSASLASLGGTVICSLIFRTRQAILGGLLWGHIFALTVFLVLIHIFKPALLSELQTGRDMHQLHHINQSGEAFNRRLEDASFRQQMLFEAVKSYDMPETTYRGLLAKGANPFQTYAFQGFIFSIAVERHNFNALRVFSEQLDGSTEQAKNNRLFLTKNNPLDEHFYFSATPNEEQTQQYNATAKVILDKMPELLTDKVYARILATTNKDIIQFLWQYHPPEKRIYRIQAEALLGMLTSADNIAAAPGVLTEKPAADYSKTLWEYLVEYAPQPVIQAILQKNVVQWADYVDKNNNNPVLEKAILRAKKIWR
ncbi:hypothetical protein NB069_11265 [Leclercia adecarboxylata]|uniref:hypothetical protein n=1 Tax=Leclercia adecarboxylata TaxID=83655 RepID=UPI002029FEF7|nr:hypothetical protein [Leclercia adecarboxylata]URO01410.1 hypothetical protein NB069_11265 [Leclercia adecarboxylata]